MNKYLLKAKSFRAKKRLGQNFLVSKDVIDAILSNVNADDNVLEIGPGLGFVTEELICHAKFVSAVELDIEAYDYLSENLSGYKNLNLVNNDILKTDISSLFSENSKIKVIANIPYYITTPILVHLLGEIDEINHKTRNMIDEIVLMVQYEVAKRIVADKNSKNKEYGMLSILSNFWADTEIIKFVSKKCFYPSPKVDSALVKFKINNKPRVDITPNLRHVIKVCFATRRKNIKNCLKNSGFKNIDEALLKCNIDPNLRGENLSVEDFYELSKVLIK